MITHWTFSLFLCYYSNFYLECLITKIGWLQGSTL